MADDQEISFCGDDDRRIALYETRI